jgi:hypothetical protein
MSMNVDAGLFWRGRYHRFAGGSVDTGGYVHPATERINLQLREEFPSELAALERADAARNADKAKLLRPDGTRMYGDAEHAEREARIDQAFEAEAERVTAAAERASAEADSELVKLDGTDPLDALSAEDQQRAAARAPFIREDTELLPPGELMKRVRGVLASGDRVAMILYQRYMGQVLDRAVREGRPPDPEIRAVHDELRDKLADPKAAQRREKLLRRKSSAQVLRGRVDTVRRGGVEGIMREMKARGVGLL